MCHWNSGLLVSVALQFAEIVFAICIASAVSASDRPNILLCIVNKLRGFDFGIRSIGAMGIDMKGWGETGCAVVRKRVL